MRIAGATTRAAIAVTIALAAAGCGESTSRARATAPRPSPTEATDEGGLHAAAAPAAEAVAEPEEEAAASEPATRAPAPPASGGEAPTSVAGLTLRRLVIAHDVENREPVGADQPFVAGGEPVFAFVEMANGASEAQSVQVTFEREDGRRVGPVTLEIPANAPRWRTWARSGWLRHAGRWTVVVRAASGEILDSAQIDVLS